MRLFVPLFAAAVLFTSGCSNNDLTTPNGTIFGTWSLKTLNGSTLPVTVAPGTTITSEQLTLNADGSYRDVANFSDGSSFQEVGTYTQNNNAITFFDQTDGITYSGSVSGNVLTEISNNGQFTSVFQKD